MNDNVVKLPKRPCPFCHKHEATRLCDFVIDYIWTTAKDDHGNMIGITTEPCSNEICESCATKINGHDLCPTCYKLYLYVKENHERRLGIRRGSRWFNEKEDEE